MEFYTWQLYDEQGRPLKGKGAQKQEVVVKGLLHGVAHVWLWRHGSNGTEVLLQKRAGTKINWPRRYDKSAGGHIKLGEAPLQTAIRRAKEELNISLTPAELRFIGVCRWRAMLEDTGLIENEFQWIYVCECNTPRLVPTSTEVASTSWKACQELAAATTNPKHNRDYVPYAFVYYRGLWDSFSSNEL